MFQNLPATSLKIFKKKTITFKNEEETLAPPIVQPSCFADEDTESLRLTPENGLSSGRI